MANEIDVNRDELEVVFGGCNCDIVFAIDKVTWEYALKFENKITASEINKIKKFVFDIHHINYDKQDSREINLATTCVSCNSKANSNRDIWQNFFEERMEDIYG